MADTCLALGTHPPRTHVHKPTQKAHSRSLFSGSSPPSPPASLPSPPPLFLLPFAYSLFWACWHLKLELRLQKRHSVAKQAWSRGLQPNLDPKSQANPSVTGFLRRQADPWFRYQDGWPGGSLRQGQSRVGSCPGRLPKHISLSPSPLHSPL